MKIALSLLVLLSVCETVASGKLLAILVDGFRWDYLQKSLSLPGFDKLIKKGARIKRLIPSFPSTSNPNYYGLFTGLYAEDHGYVANKFYDPTTKKTYTHTDTSLTMTDRSFMYDGAEPLWVTALKKSKKSYMFNWVDCDVPIKGKLPTYCRKYTSSPSLQEFRQALDESLELFKNSSADLSVVFYENVDAKGHSRGPCSSDVDSAIEEVDAELNRLLTRISEKGLEEDVDVMIFSDHGMSPASTSRVVNISNVIPTSSVDVMIDYDTYVFIWPKAGKLEEVYSTLESSSPHLTVYRRADIPSDWHFQNHGRIPPILAVLDIPWYLVASDTATVTRKGVHGYDRQESKMGGFFVGVGPSFVSGSSVDALDNVNLYQMMCHSLGITPLSHKGSWSSVSSLISGA